MDDDSTTYPNSRVAELPTSDAAAPPLGELPEGPPAQARAQHPPKPVHLIDPGDVGGIGQQDVARAPRVRHRVRLEGDRPEASDAYTGAPGMTRSACRRPDAIRGWPQDR